MIILYNSNMRTPVCRININRQISDRINILQYTTVRVTIAVNRHREFTMAIEIITAINWTSYTQGAVGKTVFNLFSIGVPVF